MHGMHSWPPASAASRAASICQKRKLLLVAESEQTNTVKTRIITFIMSWRADIVLQKINCWRKNLGFYSCIYLIYSRWFKVKIVIKAFSMSNKIRFVSTWSLYLVSLPSCKKGPLMFCATFVLTAWTANAARLAVKYCGTKHHETFLDRISASHIFRGFASATKP